MAESATIDSLDIQVSASASKAEASLSEIKDLLSSIKDAFGGVTSAVKQQTKATSANAKANKNLSKVLGAIAGAAKKTSSAIGKIPRAFGRIAMYRAIRSAIKAITSATTEGLTNLKAYSDVVGTAFAPAVDNLRRHVLWLKNAFATALRPVIEALIPVIQHLVDWLVKTSDFLAQVFSVMTGKVDDKGRYTKAVLSDLEASNKKAKELRRTLLGFDEINRLDGNTGSGETSNAGLMFTQADISDEARETAEKWSTALAKIKSFVEGIDWSIVLKVLAAIVAIRGITKIVTAVKTIWAVLKPIVSFIGSIASHLGVVGGIVVAIAIAFALWGDKVSAFLDKATKDVTAFFNKLKKKVGDSQFTKGLIDTVSAAFELIAGVVSKIASIIYKLVHGDFKGAGEDLLALLKIILKGIVKLVGGIINAVLGLVADMANSILDAVRWVWNNALAPAINWVYTTFLKVKTWVVNASLDLRIGILSVIKWILEKVDSLLQSILGGVNKLISTMNEVLGTDIKPVEFHIETTAIDEKIAELEAKKLPPITETVEIVGKWTEPAHFKLQVDTSGALAAIDRIGQKVNRLGSAVASTVSALGAAEGNRSRLNIQKYASGGFPAMGTMFIAGERGAEYVGDIGGRTGVMNTEQMERALYRAMVAALTVMPPSQGGDIYLDGEKIYTSVVRRNNNQVRSTGRTALLT